MQVLVRIYYNQKYGKRGAIKMSYGEEKQKGTTTVEDFKEVQERTKQLATESFERHKKAFREWKEGEIKKVWFDSENNLCIEYKSGNWWHYNEKGEWW